MIKLMIAEQDRAVQNAIVPVRWCVEREAIDELKRRNIKDPYILLIIFPLGDDECLAGDLGDKYWQWRSGEIERKLVPMERLMDYVQFQKKGKHRIIAAIVGSDGEEKNKKLYERFIWRGGYDYLRDHDLVDYKGKYNHPYCQFSLGAAEIDIVVPDGLFAKEPPEWEKKWVNLWYENPAKDQCQFRKRRPLAYTIKPPLALIWYSFILLIRFVAATFLLLCGMRNIELKPLIHLIRYDTDDMWRQVQWPDSVFIPWLKKAKLYFYPAFLAAPIVVIPIFALTALLSHNIWIGIIVALGFPIVFSSFVIVFVLLFALFGIGLESVADLPVRIVERFFAAGKMEKKSKTYSYENDSLLVCDRSYTPSLDNLPSNRRTIYLRYMNFKAKWCKPFSG